MFNVTEEESVLYGLLIISLDSRTSSAAGFPSKRDRNYEW